MKWRERVRGDRSKQRLRFSLGGRYPLRSGNSTSGTTPSTPTAQRRISGETDFPCIYGDKVGLGRIYVKLPKDQPLEFDAWVDGVRDGRSYCGDGLSHLFDFAVNGVGVGEPGSGGKIGHSTSRLRELCRSRAMWPHCSTGTARQSRPKPSAGNGSMRNRTGISNAACRRYRSVPGT